MGKEKYLLEIRDLFRKSPVVSFSSIERIINRKKRVRQYAKQLVRNLILKKTIKKLAKGFYTMHDDPSLAVFCFKPAYLGLQDALSYHNLWEQETIPVIITAGKARQGIRKINSSNVLVRRLDKKYLFGFDYSRQSGQDGQAGQDNFYLPYSDIEKTIIDMIYFREKLSPEALSEARKKLSKKKLAFYLKFYPKTIKTRVFRVLRNP